MIDLQSVQEYFNIPFEVFYNVTNGNRSLQAIPYYKWQGQNIISMQEIEFYFSIAEAMLEEYLGETLFYTQKSKTLTLNYENIQTVQELIGKRFSTGINYFVQFGTFEKHIEKSVAVTKFCNNKNDLKFFALFGSELVSSELFKVLKLYNNNKNIPFYDMQSDEENKHFIVSGNVINLIKRDKLEDKSFSNQSQHNMQDDSLFTKQLSLEIAVCRSDLPSGTVYTNNKAYQVWIENESAGIARIVNAKEVDRHDSKINVIDFSYISSIESLGYNNIKKISDAACLLFGSMIPLDLIKFIPYFYNECKNLQKNTTKFTSANYQYIYNPFGSLFGQIEAQKLLEK